MGPAEEGPANAGLCIGGEAAKELGRIGLTNGGPGAAGDPGEEGATKGGEAAAGMGNFGLLGAGMGNEGAGAGAGRLDGAVEVTVVVPAVVPFG